MRRLILIYILITIYSTLTCQKIKFDKLIVNNIQYVSSVVCLYQDSKGYIWIGSVNGLGKYDGKNLEFFKHNKQDMGSISDDYIISIGEDSKGNIWAGTNNKLNKYLPVSGTFQKYGLNADKSSNFTGNNVILISNDHNGNMWVEIQGLIFIYNPENEKFSGLKILKGAEAEIPNILCAYEDIYGKVWIGTSNGLYIYDPENYELIKHKFKPHQNTALTENFVNTINGDGKNNIWLGTFGGIIIYERETNKFITYHSDLNDRFSLSNDQVTGIEFTDNDIAWICTNYGLNYGVRDQVTGKYKFTLYNAMPSEYNSLSSDALTCIIKDNNDRIWIGSRFGGIDIYDPNNKKFGHFAHIPTNPTSLGHNNVTHFAEDKNGYLWVSTDGGGINRMDLSDCTFKRLKFNKDDINTISSNKVLALLNDDKNMLWIGYWEAGLDMLDPVTKKITRYRYNTLDSGSISSDYIFYLMQDSKKNIWICHWGAGITLYHPGLKQFIRYPKKYQGFEELKTSTITIAYEDSKGTIWIGSENNGLYSFNYQSDAFTHYALEDSTYKSLSHRTVYSICEDTGKRLWIGTRGGGLNLFDRETGIFKQFSTSDGLPDDIICGIVEDEEGYLWISTSKGISKVKFVEESNKILCNNYNQFDGLNGNIFNQWAFYKSNNNEIYFGGIHGFNHFLPSEIKINKMPPEVRLTNIYLLDKRLTIDNKEINLQKPIDELKELILSYKYSKITFEFTALNYTQPFKNQFAYILEGFDKEWHYNGNFNKAIYTNLDPGDYIFRVKASNNDGVWNTEGTSLKLSITPPFWKTLWFKSITGILTLLVIIAIFRFRMKKYRHEIEKQKEIELILRKAKEKAEESDKLKSSILANFSHEIRTPVNGILGFTDLLARGNLDEKKRAKYVTIIKSRYNELIKTMDTILDVSTLVAGSVKINETRFRLCQVINFTEGEFYKKIEEENKKMDFKVIYNDNTEHIEILADYYKLSTVFAHLVDNAIKFSMKGTVKVLVDNQNDKLKFTISDEGIGIEENKKELVFEQFMQSDLGVSRKYGGMGLGLPLCKGILKFLGGEIWFDSAEGKGSTFYFTFPYKKVN